MGLARHLIANKPLRLLMANYVRSELKLDIDATASILSMIQFIIEAVPDPLRNDRRMLQIRSTKNFADHVPFAANNSMFKLTEGAIKIGQIMGDFSLVRIPLYLKSFEDEHDGVLTYMETTYDDVVGVMDPLDHPFCAILSVDNSL